jgi:hypothetical protein
MIKQLEGIEDNRRIYCPRERDRSKQQKEE